MPPLKRAAALALLVAAGIVAPPDCRGQVPFELKDPVDEFPGMQPALTLKGHEKYARGVAFSPDGSKIASSGEDTAILWDARTGKLLHRLNPGETKPPGAWSVAFSPDGRALAVGGYVGDVFFYDPETGKLKGTFDEPSLAVHGLAYSPDGATLFASTEQKQVMIYDVASAKAVATLTPPKGGVEQFALSDDGKTLAGMTREDLYFWDVAGRKLKGTVPVGGTGLDWLYNAVACSPAAPVAVVNGGQIVAPKTTFYDLKTLRPTGVLVAPPAEPSIKALAFSPDGKVLASGAGGGLQNRTPVSLWDVSSGERFGALLGPTEGVAWVAFSKDGRRVAAASLDHMVRVWDLPAGGPASAKAKARSKARGKAKMKKSRR